MVMAERTIRARTYVIVCAVLILLTVLTLAVSFFHLPGRWHVTIGLLIALCKGSLVVLFFMHLIISSRLTWIVVAVTVFWFLILLVLTMTDYLSRNLIPYTPGH
jgi:cytochrome c oxidase subunit 4